MISLQEEKAKNFTLLAALFYPLLFGFSLPFIYWREQTFLPYKYLRGNLSLLYQFGLGLSFGIVCVLVSILFHHLSESVRRAEYDIQELVGSLSWQHVVIIAISSAIGEEVFFRALLQPTFGIWSTSIAFGIVHIPATKNLFFYPAVAAIIGFGLGSLFIITGDGLLSPCTAHFTINLINLYRISRCLPGEVQDHETKPPESYMRTKSEDVPK
jgi:membrane protease YdiL (CAAX protease family)